MPATDQLEAMFNFITKGKSEITAAYMVKEIASKGEH